MSLKFIAPGIFVKDISRSKKFYHDIMNQDIEMDNGEHIEFKSGFAIWQGDHAYSIIYEDESSYLSNIRQKQFEMYFETEDLDNTLKRIDESGVEKIHEIHEQPWGQRVFRVYDPDGHIVEIAEPLTVVVKRYYSQGLSLEEIFEKTSIPILLIEEMLQ